MSLSEPERIAIRAEQLEDGQRRIREDKVIAAMVGIPFEEWVTDEFRRGRAYVRSLHITGVQRLLSQLDSGVLDLTLPRVPGGS